MNIRLRAIIACLVFFALFGRGQSEPLTIRTSTIDLHSEDPQIVTVGRLKYQGGLNLTSPHPRFGGLSGLSVSAEGGILVAVTDGGDWVKLTPVVSSNGRLRDIGGAQISRMLGLNGKPLRKKRDSDAESLVALNDGFAVSFEQRHRLWLYRGGTTPFQARPENIRLPEISRSMPRNGGLETLARLRDGRLIIIAQDFPKNMPHVKGWIFENNKWQGFRYRRHASYEPTGATTLPNGELLILERRFSLVGGFGSRLVTIAPDLIGLNADVTGREVAHFEWPLVTENFEGVASFRNTKGETIIYLISDDNFLVLQNTLLLKFRLEP